MTAPLFTRPFALLTLGHFLQALGYSSMVLLPLYLDHLGASRAGIGFIMAISSVAGLLLRPLVGWSLDAVGRRRTILVGTALLTISMWGIAAIDSIGPLIIVDRLIYGVGVGTLFTAYFTFASDLVPPSRRTEGIALFGVSGLLPLALVPVYPLMGMEGAELRWFFPGLGMVIACSALAILPLKEPIIDRPAAQSIRSFVASSWRTIGEPQLRPVWLATLVFSTLVAVFMTYATVTAEGRGIESSAGIWLTYAGGAVGVRLFGGRLPDRVGPHRIVAPAIGAYVVAAVLVANAETDTLFLLAGGLAGLGHGYCFPVLTSQVVTRMPDHLRGSGIAAFTALWDLVSVTLTPLFGLLADWAGDRALFQSLALFAFVGLMFWFPLERRVRKRLADESEGSTPK